VYNDPGNSYDAALALTVSPDGSRLFVTGYGFGTGLADWATVAYDAATGHRLWAQLLNGPRNGSDAASSIAVSPDGERVYLTGGIEVSPTRTMDFLTIACDADTGDRLWARWYDGPAGGEDVSNAMALSPDGTRLVVTGGSEGVGTSDDYATIAYDAGSGSTVWERRYDGPAHEVDDARSVAISPDGSTVAVTGRSTGAETGTDFGTVVYGMATGATEWARRYQDVSDDIGRSVAISPDGAMVYVTGSTGSDHPDLTALAYVAATGNLEWKSVYDGTAHQTDVPFSMVVSPDGLEVVVAGSSEGTGELGDAIVIAYQA
jgi:WD40 repeat protein